jgi:tryptophan synthase alpha chain
MSLYVSIAGVTGAREKLAETIKEKREIIRKYVDIPVGIGFGISTKEHVKELSKSFDAIVVGSAIVRHFEDFSSEGQLLEDVSGFVKELKSATKVN